MTPGVRPLVAGNWKMNGLSGSLAEIDAMRQAADAGKSGPVELLVCPPATLLAQAAWRIKGGELSSGAQDCHPVASGAFTGDISAPMLHDAGASYVIVGIPSGARSITRPTPSCAPRWKRRLARAWYAIVCVGETKTERQSGHAKAVVPRHCEARCPRRRQRDVGGRLRADLGDRHRASPRRPRTSPRCIR